MLYRVLVKVLALHMLNEQLEIYDRVNLCPRVSGRSVPEDIVALE